MIVDEKLSPWIEKAIRFPVGFAQVREDPLLDLNLINQQNKTDFAAIMIASGGCTAALLAVQPKIKELTIVDANPAQLALTQLKLNLMENHESDERLAILGHVHMEKKKRKAWIENSLLALSHPYNILGDLDTVSRLGLDFLGRYEILFLELQKKLEPYTNLLLNELSQLESYNDSSSSNFLDQIQQPLKLIFSQVMTQSNLVALYGQEATQNPRMPFWEHFYSQTILALRSTLKFNNPFLSQMLLGKFSQEPYEWIKQPRQPIQVKLNFENLLINQMLDKKTDCYSFVHLSNALDWLSELEARNLLASAEKSMKKGGGLILRQLNSTLDIPKLSPSNIQWQISKGENLLQEDRSFFYRCLLIGTKI